MQNAVCLVAAPGLSKVVCVSNVCLLFMMECFGSVAVPCCCVFVQMHLATTPGGARDQSHLKKWDGTGGTYPGVWHVVCYGAVCGMWCGVM